MMIPRKYVLLFFLSFFSLPKNGLEAAKILVVFPVDAKSHYIMYGTILRELATRGHEITVASYFPESPDTPNIKYIDIRNIMETPMYTLEYLKEMTPMDGIPDIIDYSVEVCINSMNMTSIKELQSNKYDLLISELFGCDCFLALGYKMNIPVVGVISSITLPWTTPIIGHFENPSYIPSYFLHYGQKMNLWQRLINTVFNIYANVAFEITSNEKIQNYVEENFGSVPHLRNIRNNVSLILINSHFSINHVKPALPQLIEVGGLHIPRTIPHIPKDLEKFFNESKEGVILFSLGSYAQAETFPKEKMNAILEVLGSLPHNILWKINATTLSNLPPNIKTSTWVPQLEVLCDSRTKMFIAHGGLLGMQESMYCGVPILGIPLFADQYANLRSVEEKGAGLLLYYDDIDKEELSSKVNKILYEKSYRENAKTLSNLFKDRPQPPLEAAVYWIEYVLRNNGATHLKSPAQELSWYQYLLIDVFLIIFSSLLIIIYLIIFTFKSLCKSKPSKEKGERKSKKKKA